MKAPQAGGNAKRFLPHVRLPLAIRLWLDTLRMTAPGLLTDLLKNVSRSFYLTLRALPGAIRPQIGLAYLLARATDTIADTEIVPVAERLEALDHLRERILGRSEAPLEFRRFINRETDPPSTHTAAEQVLLDRLEDALAVLRGFGDEDQKRIQEVLHTITSGQELDLRRFGAVSHSAGSTLPSVTALASAAELDDYTYRVAGCVGEFWTKMCRAHLFPDAAVDEAALLKNGVRFGKGLQLVNVLRDLPKDLRLGRCYLPGNELAGIGLAPADLLNPVIESRLRPLYDRYLDCAEAHLSAGWDYTNALPRGCARVRLACAWPILIGVKTLARLRAGRVLDPARRIKVAKSEVWGIVLGSLLQYPLPSRWRRQFAHARRAGRDRSDEPRPRRAQTHIPSC